MNVGTTGNDYAWGVAVDPSGDVYMSGQSPSSSGPVHFGGTSNAFTNAGFGDGWLIKCVYVPPPRVCVHRACVCAWVSARLPSHRSCCGWLIYYAIHLL